MSKRNRNKSISNSGIKKESIDFALLTCGMVELQLFNDCVKSILREMLLLKQNGIDSNFYAIMNGVDDENKSAFRDVLIKAGATISNSPRTGFSEGANRVIKQGRSPLVLFITDDIILHEGSVSKLVQRMKSDDKISLCGMKLLFPETKDSTRPSGRVQHIGHGFDSNMECVHPLIGWKPDNPKCNISRELQSVTGAVFMVKRQPFEKVKGFFTGYGIGYYEDTDLCFALRSLGTKVWIEAEAVATHFTNASMSKAKQPIPMNENKALFRSRWGKFILPDTWSFW